MAAVSGSLDTLQLLLERGATTDSPGQGGLTPLHIAAASSKTECVRLLLEHGANKDARAQVRVSRSRLHVVAPTPAARALTRSAAACARAQSGRTPLHEAAESGALDCLDLLIRSGAEMSAGDEDGGTPLHLAAAEGELDCMELLMDYGAPVNATMEARDRVSWRTLLRDAHRRVPP